MKKIMTTTILLLMLWSVLSAQQSSNTTLVGSWGGYAGDFNAIAVKGDIVYTNEGRWLKIINVENKSNPVQLSKLEMPAEASNIFVSGNYVYVVGRFKEMGFLVIDVTDPNNPNEVWYSDAYDYSYMDVVVDSNYVYLVSDSLYIFEINNPSNSQIDSGFDLNLVGSLRINGTARGITVDSVYAYVAAGSMRIIDISDRSNPTEVGFYGTQFGNFITHVTVAGEYAYVLDNGSSYGMAIIDISNPSNPTEVGRYVFGGIPYHLTGVAVNGNIVYGVSLSSLYIINVSNPSNPLFLWAQNIPALDIVIKGKFVYLASGSFGMRIYDVSNSNNPLKRGIYQTIGTADNITLKGNHAYVAIGRDGMAVVDISTLSNPKKVASHNISYHSVNDIVSVGFSHLLLATDALLYVVDVSDPSHPANVQQSTSYGWDFQSIAVVCDKAFLPRRILDLSDIKNPITIADFYDKSTYWMREIVVSGNYAFLAVNERPTEGIDFSGLRIIDISDLLNPVEAGSLATGVYVRDLAVRGNYAYIAADTSGLWIIDISDPYTPTEITSFQTAGSARGVDIGGDYLYVADGEAGLRIFNVSDPSNPLEVGYYDMGDSYFYASDVEVRGAYAFVMYGEDGMKIIRNELSSEPVVYGQVYPGDSNNDCIVDVRDILPIARHYETIGPVRENASLDWGPQPLTEMWSSFDAAYADGDGNGVVDAEDVEGILRNWFATPSDGVPASINRVQVAEDLLRGIDAQPASRAMSEIRKVIVGYMNEELGIIFEYALEQNHPNPFNSATTIRFNVPQEVSKARLSIYNILGQLVWERSLKDVSRGIHEIVWDGSSTTDIQVSSGVYFYKFSAGNYMKTKRMVFLK